jgi:predicted transposase YbfD/YdcC
VWVDLENAKYIRETLDLPGCCIALRVDREQRRSDGEVVYHDVRYFISSLDPDKVTAAELLQHVRGHWKVENGLHFLKDRWWDEDRHHTRRPGLAACLAAINNAAVSIHRLRSDPDIPVRASADQISWNPALGLELLNS